MLIMKKFSVNNIKEASTAILIVTYNSEAYISEQATDKALYFLEKFMNRKLFMLIHYWDTHIPYFAPESLVGEFIRYYRGGIFDKSLEEILQSIKGPWRERLIDFFGKDTTIGEIMARYDASARYIDLNIKKLIEWLEDHDLIDETLVIITSDHGESLIEHGIYFDHHGLYDVSIRVPLIFYGANMPRKRIRSLVQHVDLAPTILALTGIQAKHYMEGYNLAPLIEGEVDDNLYALREFVYAEEAYTERKYAIRNDRYKYIMSPSPHDALCRYCGIIHGGLEELYDLKRDPNEEHNIIDEKPDIAKELRTALESFLKRVSISERAWKALEKRKRDTK